MLFRSHPRTHDAHVVRRKRPVAFDDGADPEFVRAYDLFAPEGAVIKDDKNDERRKDDGKTDQDVTQVAHEAAVCIQDRTPARQDPALLFAKVDPPLGLQLPARPGGRDGAT